MRSLASLALLGGVGQGVWLDVPFVPQSERGCGAACIVMVMLYWSGKVGGARSAIPTSEEVLDELYSEQAEGIHASAVAEYLRRQGYRVFAFAGDWSDLEHHLRKGRPLIVGIRPATGSRQNHFLVVAGLDLESNTVMVNDPARRKLSKVRRSQFERDWKKCGNWTLLALPPLEM